MNKTIAEKKINVNYSVADSNGVRISLAEVIRRANARSISASEGLNQNKNDVYKKYKEYIVEIAEALCVKEELEKIKVNNRYDFTPEAAKCLEELLVEYEANLKGRDAYATKGMVKQIIKGKQYNAFLPQDMFEVFKDMNRANQFIVQAMECFFVLFVSCGFTEEEANEKLTKADRLYLYSQRKSSLDFMNFVQKYMGRLLMYNGERHSMLGLTSREHAIWLDYSNSEIIETMAKMLLIRMEMKDIKEKDTERMIVCKYLLQKEQDVNVMRELEEKITKACETNGQVQSIQAEYRGITQKELDLERIVAYTIINQEEEELEMQRLLLCEILGVPADGGGILYKTDVKRIEELLSELHSIIREETRRYAWLEIWAGEDERIKDMELLHKAKENVEK